MSEDSTPPEPATAAVVRTDSGQAPISRRRLLRRSGIAIGSVGLAIGGVGTAAANGKGGQSVIPADAFEGGGDRFQFIESTGDLKLWQCDKGGQGIRLAEWTFEYTEDDAAALRIYTRDNAIDTSQTYRLNRQGAVDCGDFHLCPFSRA